MPPAIPLQFPLRSPKREARRSSQFLLLIRIPGMTQISMQTRSSTVAFLHPDVRDKTPPRPRDRMASRSFLLRRGRLTCPTGTVVLADIVPP